MKDAWKPFAVPVALVDMVTNIVPTFDMTCDGITLPVKPDPECTGGDKVLLPRYTCNIWLKIKTKLFVCRIQIAFIEYYLEFFIFIHVQ